MELSRDGLECDGRYFFDILAAVKRTAIPHHATFLEWSLNGVDASRDAASLTEV
ncbi:MAG: hypothetical protein GPJ02_24890, partial [Microcystis aeruginosa G13-12]|nr:hypothetical protein [Microcystis aeruginosa SX13-11]NCR47233.1 hypothetical protein [Microcystis aeruginosa SX13-01]NCS18493.1 hypothetical protein [Microcystis aeruginosa G13-12]